MEKTNQKLFNEEIHGGKDKTLSVREINELISGVIKNNFDTPLWVRGEVQRLNFHSSGHTYFNLVDSHGKGSTCTIPINLFKHIKSRIKGNIHEILEEDREVRLLVKPDFYAPYGKMSLNVEDIDTSYVLGQVALARRLLLERLEKEGILRANAQSELPDLATNIVLITAQDSAAYHDVTDQLRSSGIGFHIRFINAFMQGADSIDSVSYALTKADTLQADVVLLCRGGGSKSDLSSFDSEKVARTICAMTTPVVTGLGHQIDISVADIVAHTSVKTPTACAEYLIKHVRDSINATQELIQRIHLESKSRLDDAQIRLAYTLQRLSDSKILLEGCIGQLNQKQRNIRTSVLSTLDLASQYLGSLNNLMRAHDPLRVVERGYSLTFDSRGHIVSSIDSVDPSQEIITRVKDGDIYSSVTKKKQIKE